MITEEELAQQEQWEYEQEAMRAIENPDQWVSYHDGLDDYERRQGIIPFHVELAWSQGRDPYAEG